MACRLAGAKPLSEPMWDIVDWALGNKFQWNLTRNSYIFIHENAFENVVWKMAAILCRSQCVNLNHATLGLFRANLVNIMASDGSGSTGL